MPFPYQRMGQVLSCTNRKARLYMLFSRLANRSQTATVRYIIRGLKQMWQGVYGLQRPIYLEDSVVSTTVVMICEHFQISVPLSARLGIHSSNKQSIVSSSCSPIAIRSTRLDRSRMVPCVVLTRQYFPSCGAIRFSASWKRSRYKTVQNTRTVRQPF